MYAVQVCYSKNTRWTAYMTKCYPKNTPWTAYMTKVIPKTHPEQHTWRRLFQKHPGQHTWCWRLFQKHPGHAYMTKVIPKTPWTAYMTKVFPNTPWIMYAKVYSKYTLDSIHDEGYSKNTSCTAYMTKCFSNNIHHAVQGVFLDNLRHDEGYSKTFTPWTAYMMKVIPKTPWTAYMTKVIPKTPWTAYMMKVIPKNPGQHTWGRLFQKHTLDSIHDEGYSKNNPGHAYRVCFWNNLRHVCCPGCYSKNTLDSIHVFGRLFQKHPGQHRHVCCPGCVFGITVQGVFGITFVMYAVHFWNNLRWRLFQKHPGQHTWWRLFQKPSSPLSCMLQGVIPKHLRHVCCPGCVFGITFVMMLSKVIPKNLRHVCCPGCFWNNLTCMLSKVYLE